MDWGTPQDLFDRLSKEFGGFDLDVCANAENAKCPRYFTEKDDGLSQDWKGYCWMNPPYGREIGKWIEKAYHAAGKPTHINPLGGDATVVCLLPARTDTQWWHEYCMKADTVRFIRGRLKFEGSENSAPFPSAIVIFGQYPRYQWGYFSYEGRQRRQAVSGGQEAACTGSEGRA